AASRRVRPRLRDRVRRRRGDLGAGPATGAGAGRRLRGGGRVPARPRRVHPRVNVPRRRVAGRDRATRRIDAAPGRPRVRRGRGLGRAGEPPLRRRHRRARRPRLPTDLAHQHLLRLRPRHLRLAGHLHLRHRRLGPDDRRRAPDHVRRLRPPLLPRPRHLRQNRFRPGPRRRLSGRRPERAGVRRRRGLGQRLDDRPHRPDRPGVRPRRRLDRPDRAAARGRPRAVQGRRPQRHRPRPGIRPDSGHRQVLADAVRDRGRPAARPAGRRRRHRRL
ncbi:MAG: Glutamine cyclotransferase, partial [uncultured Thermomicrobiales bacterium]